jgi:hypothetical protein
MITYETAKRFVIGRVGHHPPNAEECRTKIPLRADFRVMHCPLTIAVAANSNVKLNTLEKCATA